jgi:hypothetical protein
MIHDKGNGYVEEDILMLAPLWAVSTWAIIGAATVRRAITATVHWCSHSINIKRSLWNKANGNGNGNERRRHILWIVCYPEIPCIIGISGKSTIKNLYNGGV